MVNVITKASKIKYFDEEVCHNWYMSMTNGQYLHNLVWRKTLYRKESFVQIEIKLDKNKVENLSYLHIPFIAEL
jgi:hypothetical protein